MNKKIVCFGEVLWDMLPKELGGKLPGGAPMNVAYHLNCLGVNTKIVSRVGNDILGTELTGFLAQKEVSTQFIQTDTYLPTGFVDVTLDEKGSPSYKIVQPVAWDNILLTEDVKKAVSEADAFVYGSLVCRTDVSKQTLLELINLSKCPVFDVNLRTPFYSKEIIEQLLKKATIAKMNEFELDIISDWYGSERGFLERIKCLQTLFEIKTLIVSHGSVGAYCFENNTLYFQKSYSVKVKDTIGSGDAFLAAFLSEKIIGNQIPDCLKKACALGAFVATQTGATPAIDKEKLEDFILKTHTETLKVSRLAP